MAEQNNMRRVFIFILASFLVSITNYGQEERDGSVTIDFGHYESIYSKLLDEERTIFVHLPEDYNSSEKKYPVLYVLDAENTHRFVQSIASIFYYSSARILPKMIVVGIVNTDRNRDLTPVKINEREGSGGGDTFLDFIVTELQPYIENKYRAANYSILFGGSTAGMFTLYSLLAKPSSFDAFIASRPALNTTSDMTWDSEVIFRKAIGLLDNISTLKKKLYIDHGSQEDLYHDPLPIHKLSSLLYSKAPRDFNWEIQKMEESGYRSAESLKKGLLSIFSKWYYAADSLYLQGFSGIDKHATILTEMFGYTISVADILSERDLITFGHQFLEQGNLVEALSLFKYSVDAYPDSWIAHGSLADAYFKNGNKKIAEKHFRISLELHPDNEYAKEMLNKLKNN